MISEVRILVSELRRITLLWDELWLGTLVQRQTDISRRINQLEVELSKTENHSHLTDIEKEHIAVEKYTMLLKPVIYFNLIIIKSGLKMYFFFFFVDFIYI